MLVRSWLKPFNAGGIRVFKGGSAMKKTMICGSDLDIVVYFPHTDNRSPKMLKDAVAKELEKKIEVDTSARMALKLKVDKIGVDVVVAKAQDASFTAADAYNDDTSQKQRIDITIHRYQTKGLALPIRMMKIITKEESVWWTKFAMEQYLISTLKGKDCRDLGLCLQTVLLRMKSDIITVKDKDAANSNNDIWAAMDDEDRAKLKKWAEEKYKTIKESVKVK